MQNKITFRFTGESAHHVTRGFENWLREAQIVEVANVEQLSKAPEGDELGHEWLDVLLVIVGTDAVATVIEKLFDYFDASRVQAEVEIDADGKIMGRFSSKNPRKAIKAAREFQAEQQKQANSASEK